MNNAHQYGCTAVALVSCALWHKLTVTLARLTLNYLKMMKRLSFTTMTTTTRNRSKNGAGGTTISSHLHGSLAVIVPLTNIRGRRLRKQCK